MPWTALKRLMEMQGITMGFESATKLHRLIKVKGNHEMVNYKEALSYVMPNFELDDPIRSVWVIREGGPQAEFLSKMGSRMSKSTVTNT